MIWIVDLETRGKKHEKRTFIFSGNIVVDSPF